MSDILVPRGAETKHKSVLTGDFQTHYLEAGHGEPLILVHGGGAGADAVGNWSGTIPIFAEHHHVYALDMVGFGASDAPDPDTFVYSQEARNKQLVDFIEALGIAGTSIIGNSMGGSTALGVALTRPDLVSNIVLMGSSGLSHEVSNALRPMMEYDFTIEGMRKIVDVLTNSSFQPSEEQLRYRVETSLRPAVRKAYGATMKWVRDQGGLHYDEDAIAACETRTLIFGGLEDRVVPMREAIRFLELMPNAHGHFIPNCGHWAMAEYPEVFARVTQQFLRNYRD